MKKITLFFGIFLIVSCSDSGTDININKNNTLPNLTVSEIEHLIPELYETSVKVVYKNNQEMEKEFQISYSKETEKRTFGVKEFEVEKLTVNIVNNNSPKIAFYITTVSDYSSIDTYYQQVMCGFSTIGYPGIKPTMIIDAESTGIWEAELLNEKILNNQTFKNVFSAVGYEELSSFSELFYTAAEGIVGFRDFENTLWVLDRYE